MANYEVSSSRGSQVKFLRQKFERGSRIVSGNKEIWENGSITEITLKPTVSDERWIIREAWIHIVDLGNLALTGAAQKFVIQYPEKHMDTITVKTKTVDLTDIDNLISELRPESVQHYTMNSIEYVMGLLPLGTIILDSGSLSDNDKSLLVTPDASLGITTGKIIININGWKIKKIDY